MEEVYLKLSSFNWFPILSLCHFVPKVKQRIFQGKVTVQKIKIFMAAKISHAYFNIGKRMGTFLYISAVRSNSLCNIEDVSMVNVLWVNLCFDLWLTVSDPETFLCQLICPGRLLGACVVINKTKLEDARSLGRLNTSSMQMNVFTSLLQAI